MIRRDSLLEHSVRNFANLAGLVALAYAARAVDFVDVVRPVSERAYVRSR